ncbi:MAG: hypothetical protein ABI970_26820, partial [Chloroflexota bacterium]
IAIDAHILTDDTQFMQYQRQTPFLFPADPHHKRKMDGLVKKAVHSIERPNWMSGNELFDQFSNGQIGSEVHFRQGNEPMTMVPPTIRWLDAIELPSGEDQDKLQLTDGTFNRLLKTVEDKTTNYGIMLRLWDV